MDSKRKILVIGPHSDDGELGCGGMMSKRIAMGHEVHYIVFSACQRSVPSEFDPDILKKETVCASKELGIPKDNLSFFDYDVRTFPIHRQDILEDMWDLQKRIEPDLVFCPCRNDIHQDHATVAAEAIRCFKKQSILGYEEPWNNISFPTNAFEILSEEDLRKKTNALMCYKSQGHRPYFNEEAIRSLAITRGTQLEGGFAEAFEVIRWML